MRKIIEKKIVSVRFGNYLLFYLIIENKLDNNNERINIDYTNKGYKKRLNKMQETKSKEQKFQQDNMRNNHPQSGKNQIRTGDHERYIIS